MVWVLAAVLSAAFVLSFPERLYGDDVFLVWCIVRERVFTPHFLYMPLARLAARAGAHGGLDPFTTLRVMAALGTAAGGALLLLAARRRGADARIALVFALLVVTASSTWFFATAAEIHGVHLAAVGLLAWTLAGLQPAGPATRVLLAALAFGAAVGTHRSGVLLLPGALAVYLLATAGRARGDRIRDLAALALGGAVSLGAMAASNLAAAGRLLVTEDSPRRLFELLCERFDPGDAFVYLGTDAIAPSFALALLGCAALGSLLRRDRPRFLVLAAFVVPYWLFFPLYDYEERGAYFLPLLPALSGAVLLACTTTGPPDPGRRRTTGAGVVLLLVALAGALLTPDELVDLRGPNVLPFLPATAFVLGLLAPLPHLARTRTIALAAALVAAQLAGSARTLHAFDREQPVLDWGRDTVAAIGGPDRALILTGFERLHLAHLLREPWPAPFTDTWAYQRELPTTGPIPFDVSVIGPKSDDEVHRFLEGGGEVYLLDTVPLLFGEHPRLGPYIREWERRYDLQPVSHGSFEAHRMLLRE